MTPSREPEATEAYTRASVEAYLRAASDEKARLRKAIAEARTRVARAQLDEQYLNAHHDIDHAPTDQPAGWDIEESAGGSFPAAGSPGGTGFSPESAGGSSFRPDKDIPFGQLRLTPGTEDIWRSLDFPSALAHE
jgi:hypothetical protein